MTFFDSTKLSRMILFVSLMGFSGSFFITQGHSQTVPLRTDADRQTFAGEMATWIPHLMERAHVPGMSIAVIKDGRIFWHDSFGYKRAGKETAVNDSTLFQAASLSKTVFTYAVLQLVEKGVLDLDTPLSDYLKQDYVSDDDRDTQITARIILNHTTGFPNWRQPRNGPLKIYFTPGDKFSYSGEGFVYLQKVVEKVTEKSLNEFISEVVFTPLGMRHSSYEWRGEFASNYAIGHNQFDVAIERDPMTEGNAAYSLYTTALDYAKFLTAILNGKGLQNETIREMLTPQIQLDKNCTNCINQTTSELSDENAWGLGWGIQTTDEGTSFWHWGDQGIYRCYTVAFRDQKIGLVYFTNSENGLAIRDELVSKTIGGMHPAFAWLVYDSYKSPAKRFGWLITDKGLAEGIAYVDSLKKKTDAGPVFEERAINKLGYHFLRSDQIETAIAIFKLNVQEYPDSWNVYDSLAEAYMEDGRNELAIAYYNKSLQINPENTNGKEMLEKIKAERRADK